MNISFDDWQYLSKNRLKNGGKNQMDAIIVYDGQQGVIVIFLSNIFDSIETAVISLHILKSFQVLLSGNSNFKIVLTHRCNSNKYYHFRTEWARE